jgi:alkyldihydroxyacetonephosphate synthase
MTGMAKVKWVKSEDRVALVEAGITGTALKEALQKKGMNMGMEPDSMELSTLGGWIATRASGMKRARYGNIEDMIIEVRVVTPSGILWQHHGEVPSSTGMPTTAFGRSSTNVGLPGLFLGSEGCLGIIVAAVVRVRPVPEVVEYDSVIFPTWEAGAAWMREVARLPPALRPASSRLMDSKQLSLARAIQDDPTKGQLRGLLKEGFLALRGVSMDKAAAVTLVFEGSKDEVAMQKCSLKRLLKGSGGIFGGASSGEAGYALTYAIAYIRDFGLDHQILAESLETMVPWSAINKVWPAVVSAVEAEHSVLRLPGKPFLSCRMTQLYDEGGVLYMYIAICTVGLSPDKALEAFHTLEDVSRKTILRQGGCLSHHHGIGKHRAALLENTQAPATSAALKGLKLAMDPENILGARNGAWADDSGLIPGFCPGSSPSPATLPSCAVNGFSTMGLQEDFDKVVKIVSEGTPKSSKKADNDHKLRLYGWYKQATCGDIEIAKPWAIQIEACLKWDAWNKHKGKSKEDAMEGYVKEANDQIEEFDIVAPQ